jgi:hypothetical protein
MDRESHEETQPLARVSRAASMENGLMASASAAASEVSCEESSERAPPSPAPPTPARTLLTLARRS